MSEALTIGSLFTGAGLLDLGIVKGLAAGGVASRVLWQVELEKHCHPVLERHYPTTDRRVRNVTLAHCRFATVAGVPFVAGALAPVDIMVGGFPCQDLSVAGKGAGLAGVKSGLWWHFWRLLREIRPRFVVLENVSAIVVRGMEHVLGALAVLGYDAEWRVFGAVDVGAPHRRMRWACVAWLANAHGSGRESGPISRKEPAGRTEPHGCCGAVPHAKRDPVWTEQEPESGCGGAVGVGADGAPQSLANPIGNGSQGLVQAGSTEGSACRTSDVADSNRRRCKGERGSQCHRCEDGPNAQRNQPHRRGSEPGWGNGSSRSSTSPVGGLGGVADGLPAWMDWSVDPADTGAIPRAVESAVLGPRGSAERRLNRERLTMLGNGVVPAWAFQGGLRVAQLARGDR